MTIRATARGDERTSLDGLSADVLICGASFAGLAVARELAESGADVLVIDRYEIGERATSACAVPTPWLNAMGLQSSARQELECMTFATVHGSWRYRLPWSWTSFDYRELCLELWSQCGHARFETAVVKGKTAAGVMTDRGEIRAKVKVDALGWRRVLGESGYQPPQAPLSRGLEVHPTDGRGEDLDIWIDRSLIARGYGWSVPADGERRVGVGSYRPSDHVREPVMDLANRLECDAERYQGNWFPHRLREASEPGIFFVGDSAGHCIPLSGEGIRTAFYFGIACGREISKVINGGKPLGDALADYAAFSNSHERFYRLTLAMQRVLPAIPPRLLSTFLSLMSRPKLVRRAFGWYLAQADPSFEKASVGAKEQARVITNV